LPDLIQVYFFPANVEVVPTFAHLEPGVMAAYEFGIMDIKKAISVTAASNRFISSPYSTLLPVPRNYFFL